MLRWYSRKVPPKAIVKAPVARTPSASQTRNVCGQSRWTYARIIWARIAAEASHAGMTEPAIRVPPHQAASVKNDLQSASSSSGAGPIILSSPDLYKCSETQFCGFFRKFRDQILPPSRVGMHEESGRGAQILIQTCFREPVGAVADETASSDATASRH
jgi:hypothetical protein